MSEIPMEPADTQHPSAAESQTNQVQTPDVTRQLDDNFQQEPRQEPQFSAEELQMEATRQEAKRIQQQLQNAPLRERDDVSPEEEAKQQAARMHQLMELKNEPKRKFFLFRFFSWLFRRKRKTTQPTDIIQTPQSPVNQSPKETLPNAA